MLVDAVGLLDLDRREAGGFEGPGELCLGECSRDATRPPLHVAPHGITHLLVGDDVGYREPTPRAEDSGGLAHHPTLVGRKVDDAVRDDDVHALVRKRNLLYVAL